MPYPGRVEKVRPVAGIGGDKVIYASDVGVLREESPDSPATPISGATTRICPSTVHRMIVVLERPITAGFRLLVFSNMAYSDNGTTVNGNGLLIDSIESTGIDLTTLTWNNQGDLSYRQITATTADFVQTGNASYHGGLWNGGVALFRYNSVQDFVNPVYGFRIRFEGDDSPFAGQDQQYEFAHDIDAHDITVVI